MELQSTAVFPKVPEGYIRFIEEFPAANTQGAEDGAVRDSVPASASWCLESL